LQNCITQTVSLMCDPFDLLVGAAFDAGMRNLSDRAIEVA